MKYAANLYEAMRPYWSDADQHLYVFRLREHLRRLPRSAKIACIPLPADLARFGREITEAMRANDLHEDLHLRLIVFADSDDGGLACAPGSSSSRRPFLPPAAARVIISRIDSERPNHVFPATRLAPA